MQTLPKILKPKILLFPSISDKVYSNHSIISFSISLWLFLIYFLHAYGNAFGKTEAAGHTRFLFAQENTHFFPPHFSQRSPNLIYFSRLSWPYSPLLHITPPLSLLIVLLNLQQPVHITQRCKLLIPGLQTFSHASCNFTLVTSKVRLSPVHLSFPTQERSSEKDIICDRQPHLLQVNGLMISILKSGSRGEVNSKSVESGTLDSKIIFA